MALFFLSLSEKDQSQTHKHIHFPARRIVKTQALMENATGHETQFRSQKTKDLGHGKALHNKNPKAVCTCAFGIPKGA